FANFAGFQILDGRDLVSVSARRGHNRAAVVAALHGGWSRKRGARRNNRRRRARLSDLGASSIGDCRGGLAAGRRPLLAEAGVVTPFTTARTPAKRDPCLPR